MQVSCHKIGARLLGKLTICIDNAEFQYLGIIYLQNEGATLCLEKPTSKWRKRFNSSSIQLKR
jgi:hypothetical protein